jgi:hypothetical protein
MARTGADRPACPLVRVRWFLTLASVVLLVVGLTVVIHDRLDDGGQATASTGTTDGGGEVPAGPGLVKVTGTITAMHLEGAVLDPRTVPTPLTLTSERGMGNGAELTGVDVAGKPSVIVWDGGRPFVLASGPGVELDPVVVDLGTDGVRLTLGDGAHTIQPGTYQLNTPVAVGGASTTPSARDAVAFQAGPNALLEAKGDTALVFPHTGTPVHLKGPGNVHLVGTLTITRGKDHRSARSVDLSAAPFTLILTPITGGWAVAGSLQSQVGNDLSVGG